MKALTWLCLFAHNEMDVYNNNNNSGGNIFNIILLLPLVQEIRTEDLIGFYIEYTVRFKETNSKSHKLTFPRKLGILFLVIS